MQSLKISNIEEIDEKLLNEIKKLVRSAYPQAKFRVKAKDCKCEGMKLSKRTLKAIEEVRRGEVIECVDFEDFKRKMKLESRF